MNVESMELKSCKDERTLEELQDLGYTEVPPALNRAARRKLAGRDRAVVSRTSGGKLSTWAAAERKRHRKIAQESRRRNRQG